MAKRYLVWKQTMASRVTDTACGNCPWSRSWGDEDWMTGLYTWACTHPQFTGDASGERHVNEHKHPWSSEGGYRHQACMDAESKPKWWQRLLSKDG